METVIEVTKSELIEAMHSYNLASLEKPEDFVEITNSKEDAKGQVEELIKHLVKIRG